MSSSPNSDMTSSDTGSGYVSAAQSEVSLSDIHFTKPHLKFLNEQLSHLEPEAILNWAILTLPKLYQTTAFGLTGLVTIDMISKLYPASKYTTAPIELIFYDTLHHFKETISLIDRIRARYPHIKLHIFQPQHVTTEAEFAQRYGSNLWFTDDERYDFLAKVEPAQRAYAQLNVHAVLTGRRRSQGGERGSLDIVEVDEETGLIKVNPFANWSFSQVRAYIRQHSVPYNALLDQGYKSVGDWHSTQPVGADGDERSGRWKGTAKTECGIHNSKSRYASFLREQEAKKNAAQVDAALNALVLEQALEVQPVVRTVSSNDG